MINDQMRVLAQYFSLGVLAGFLGGGQIACGSDDVKPDELYNHLIDPVELNGKDAPYFRMSSINGENVLVQTLISKDGKCFVYTDQIRVLQVTKVSRRVGLVRSMEADEFQKNLSGLSNSIETMEKWPAQGAIHPGPTIEFRRIDGQVKIARLNVMDIGSYPKPIAAFLSLFRDEFFQSFEKPESDGAHPQSK